MDEWPTISIVVPNYNGGATLGRALQSLIDQDYPALEIIVVDGGSTDHSVDIIRQYEQHIAHWESGPDRGQSHAINKGFARCTGEVVNWLCSDDVLMPGALECVGHFFNEHSDVDVLAGACQSVDADSGEILGVVQPTAERAALMPVVTGIAQPSCFYRRALLDRSPPLRESYHYAMDTELWNYFQALGARWAFSESVLSRMYMSEDNKTTVGGEAIAEERERIYRAYANDRIPLTFWHRLLRHPLHRSQVRARSAFARATLHQIDRAAVAFLSPFYGRRRVGAMNWRNFLASARTRSDRSE